MLARRSRRAVANNASSVKNERVLNRITHYQTAQRPILHDLSRNDGVGKERPEQSGHGPGV